MRKQLLGVISSKHNNGKGVAASERQQRIDKSENSFRLSNTICKIGD